MEKEPPQGTGKPPLLDSNMDGMIYKLGEDFRMLLLHTQYKKKLENPWEAVPNKRRRPDLKSGKGKTPEEALQNLISQL